MRGSNLGKTYRDGEIIVKQDDTGDCMYVIQKGKAEVIRRKHGKDVVLSELGEGDFFGEMALFENETRSAQVRAKGEVYVLTLDKRALFRRIQADPSLVFRVLEKMSSRLRALSAYYTRIRATDRRRWETRPEESEYKR